MKTQPIVQVLGPTSVVKDGQSLDLGGPRQRRLLAALTIDAGEAALKIVALSSPLRACCRARSVVHCSPDALGRAGDINMAHAEV